MFLRIFQQILPQDSTQCLPRFVSESVPKEGEETSPLRKNSGRAELHPALSEQTLNQKLPDNTSGLVFMLPDKGLFAKPARRPFNIVAFFRNTVCNALYPR